MLKECQRCHILPTYGTNYATDPVTKESITLCVSCYNKAWRSINKDKTLRTWTKALEKYRLSLAYHINRPSYIAKKLRQDPIFKLTYYLRCRINGAIKNNRKEGSAVRDLGCMIEFFKEYIEDKFYSGMTWNNWGEVWELDHIEALFKFDLTDRKQFLKAVNYKNMQPLLILDHTKKTAKEATERSRS